MSGQQHRIPRPPIVAYLPIAFQLQRSYEVSEHCAVGQSRLLREILIVYFLGLESRCIVPQIPLQGNLDLSWFYVQLTMERPMVELIPSLTMDPEQSITWRAPRHEIGVFPALHDFHRLRMHWLHSCIRCGTATSS